MSTFGVIGDVTATLKAWAANLGALTYEQNMGVRRFKIEIPPSSTYSIAHKLGKIPTDVIFSNQENGVLDSTRDDKFVHVRNRSSAQESCKVDVLIHP